MKEKEIFKKMVVGKPNKWIKSLDKIENKNSEIKY